MKFGRIFILEMCLILGQTKKQLTPYQKETLLKSYQAKPYLKREERDQLVNLLNVSSAKIKIWFYHKRTAEREKGLLCKCKYLH